VTEPRYPSLLQVNTRVWLTARSGALGRPATLDDIDDGTLDSWAGTGFDWIWLLSVWRLGDAGRRISRTDPALRRAFEAELPDLREDDIGGSGFAITGYVVNPELGGDEALARLRQRMAARGLRLMLDFVPNHTALDHPWVAEHEEYYVQGTEEQLAAAPGNYERIQRAGAGGGGPILAHGRDPYFAGWTDTLQLDYSSPATVSAMTAELTRIADRCDGVRCDMAMLVLPDVFQRTWGRPAQPFWPEAIARVRRDHPTFRFLAEVYWDLEWTMQELGFDEAYDKRLYDRLVAGGAGPVREHLRAGLDYQSRLARFLENHDEPRAATTFPAPQHEAASLITYLTPGLRFFHGGQLEGRRVQLSPHLVRAPDEAVDPEVQRWYAWLLALLGAEVFRDGAWQLLEAGPAWDGNGTWTSLIAWAWTSASSRWLVAVNYSAEPAQALVRLPFDDLGGRVWRLTDRAGGGVYERPGDDLIRRGLYVDRPAWRAHVLEMTEVTEARDGR
jgi:glycosidase